ncbi:LuxR C-terminal-related transcriptional regulator [Nocardioides sp.]|uniref:LuxR C-terminal-related transcriptional regulator n=1 Tax=Nocardioides sp. TaxID=35761 RepID=UPI003563DB21
MTVGAPKKTRVVIVDDHVAVAEALEIALAEEGWSASRCAVPPEPAPISDLATKILAGRPDVVLVNLDLGPFGDGAPLVAALAHRGVDVVVLTGATDRARWGQALQAGASSVLSKSQPLSEVRTTIKRVSHGLPPVDRFDRAELLAAWARRRHIHGAIEARLDLLTARERAVLGALMRGQAVREIADRGVVSEATVRTQVKSILAKLQVSSQLAAVGLAHQVGWQPPRVEQQDRASLSG